MKGLRYEKIQSIIGILISIILSIPTYAGTKAKPEEDQISIRINEYEDSMGDNKTYFRIDVGDRCSLTKKEQSCILIMESMYINAQMDINKNGKAVNHR